MTGWDKDRAYVVKIWKFLPFWKECPSEIVQIELKLYKMVQNVNLLPVKKQKVTRHDESKLLRSWIRTIKKFKFYLSGFFSLNFWWRELKIFGPRRSPKGTKSDGGTSKKNLTEAKTAHLIIKPFFAILSMKYSFLRYFWA